MTHIHARAKALNRNFGTTIRNAGNSEGQLSGATDLAAPFARMKADDEQHGEPDRHDDEALEEFNKALQQAVNAVDWSQPF